MVPLSAHRAPGDPPQSLPGRCQLRRTPPSLFPRPHPRQPFRSHCSCPRLGRAPPRAPRRDQSPLCRLSRPGVPSCPSRVACVCQRIFKAASGRPSPAARAGTPGGSRLAEPGAQEVPGSGGCVSGAPVACVRRQRGLLLQRERPDQLHASARRRAGGDGQERGGPAEVSGRLTRGLAPFLRGSKVAEKRNTCSLWSAVTSTSLLVRPPSGRASGSSRILPFP